MAEMSRILLTIGIAAMKLFTLPRRFTTRMIVPPSSTKHGGSVWFSKLLHDINKEEDQTPNGFHYKFKIGISREKYPIAAVQAKALGKLITSRVETLTKESVGKSRRDAMFIEPLEPIDLGEPIYGRAIVGCAPKGATTSQLCLPFYRHFTATRFFRQTPEGRRLVN